MGMKTTTQPTDRASGKTETQASAVQVTVRPSDERGKANHGWLNSKHTFSFGSYYDPDHMGFRSLRVINQDRVAPQGGFPTHPHRDMEIFSYVLEGSLQHRDSLGNGRVLKPGQIQLMSAGSGVTHSEFNPSDTEPLHFLQIWIKPAQGGIEPGYSEWHPRAEQDAEKKTVVISPDGRDGSARIHQDAEVYRIRLSEGDSVSHTNRAGRGLWLQLISGELEVNGTRIEAGDAVSTEQAGELQINALASAEALLFDLA